MTTPSESSIVSGAAYGAIAARPYLNLTIGDLARQHVSLQPHAVALVAERDFTYAELLDEAESLAVALAGIGLEPGDVVSFQLPNWTEAFVINLASALGGFVVNPIVPIYRDYEVSQILDSSKSKLFFCCRNYRNYDFSAMVDRIIGNSFSDLKVYFVRGGLGNDYESLVASGRGQAIGPLSVDPDAPKMLLFTSGTTGRAKGVVHSHNTLSRAAQNAVNHWRIQPGDSILMPSPVTHISGFSNGLELPLIAGTRTVLMERWDSRLGVELIDRHGIVGTVAATPFLEELITAARACGSELPTLRFFACGGAPVPPDTIRTANKYLGRTCAFRIYGSSEVPFVTLGYVGEESAELAATTDGEIVDYSVRIIDENGKDLPQGAEGEIAAKGPAMFQRYLEQQPDEVHYTPDGYFLTGDLGRIAGGDGIVVTGRKKDLIVRGGENISAAEIENIISAYPSVTSVAVVAMPHERLGEGICAFITSSNEVKLTQLIDFMETTGLARQKYPEKLVIIQDMPRTPAGKIRKDLLREMAK